jgi:hypothetical protein
VEEQEEDVPMSGNPYVPHTAGDALLALTLFMGAASASAPDASGRFTAELDAGPVAIYRANGYQTWERFVSIPAGTVCEVRSFVGWDRGSVGEASLELNVSGFRLYERSSHKEGEGIYDAWSVRRARLDVGPGAFVHMVMGAAQTGPNTHDGGLSTRVHFAFRLRMSDRGDCD